MYFWYIFEGSNTLADFVFDFVSNGFQLESVVCIFSLFFIMRNVPEPAPGAWQL